jgi:hypothetical protein
LAGRRDESRRGTLKRAPQRCVETHPAFIPMGGPQGNGEQAHWRAVVKLRFFIKLVSGF